MFSFLGFMLPRRQESKRQSAIVAFRDQCSADRERARSGYAGTCEDSYATRAEYRDDELEADSLMNRLDAALQAGSRCVDLSETCIVYPEDNAIAEYEAHSCGLDYVPEDELAERRYVSRLERYADHIEAMEKVGIEVRTGFRREEAECWGSIER